MNHDLFSRILEEAQLSVEQRKLSTLHLEDWFNINSYNTHLNYYEWSFEIWARSMCYKHSIFRRIFVNPKHGFLKSQREIFSELVLEKERVLGMFESFQIKDWEYDFENQNAVNIVSVEALENEGISLENKNDFEFWVNTDNPIYLNLGYSDKEILDAVKGYLKARRKNEKYLSFAGKVTDNLTEWKNLKLLALFDLLFWRETFDSTLTYTKIGNILWPNDEIEIEQRVRKKGLPLIEKVFSSNVAKELYFEHLKTVQKSG